MKKLFLVGALALLGIANAQQNSVKVDPFSLLLFGKDMVTYERAVGEKSSVGLGAGLGTLKANDLSYNNVGGTLFYRYYFKEVLKGWYGMGSVAYGSGTVKNTENSDTEKVKFNSFNGKIKAGYQWLWNSGFTLDINAGLGYNSFNYDTKAQDTPNLKASGILPAFGLALGYSF